MIFQFLSGRFNPNNLIGFNGFRRLRAGLVASRVLWSQAAGAMPRSPQILRPINNPNAKEHPMDFRVLLAAPLAALVMSSSAADLRLPEGWLSAASWTAEGKTYEFGVDPSMDEPGRHSLLVQSVGSRDVLDIGGVTQMSLGYAGKRVRLSAQMKAADTDTWAGLVLGDKMVFLPQLSSGDADAMAHFFGAAAGADWQTVSLVVDVPSDVPWIMSGLALVGNGKVWARDPKLEVVGPDVPLSTSKIGFDIERAQARAQEQEATLAAHEKPPQNLELE
jgi:hypothetical protein